ncbi:MAG: hypothetical protein KHZ62_08780 [Clostridiales bacterium]|nr:hypothetical protein [Clostridiales bacterium]
MVKQVSKNADSNIYFCMMKTRGEQKNMEQYDIYRDIAQRTNGDIYIGDSHR